eukprot:TRINITY_DN6487_c0_g1_i1.p1 TRINITY_DN6487_c0_g1~~TRINITY_DN6487_c0_g1_i1.p1  ORF type:complete len:488 (+),score=51.88 TRINITY_DN6487_c0_g1_i1:35-1465(+)
MLPKPPAERPSSRRCRKKTNEQATATQVSQKRANIANAQLTELFYSMPVAHHPVRIRHALLQSPDSIASQDAGYSDEQQDPYSRLRRRRQTNRALLARVEALERALLHRPPVVCTRVEPMCLVPAPPRTANHRVDICNDFGGDFSVLHEVEVSLIDDGLANEVNGGAFPRPAKLQDAAALGRAVELAESRERVARLQTETRDRHLLEIQWDESASRGLLTAIAQLSNQCFWLRGSIESSEHSAWELLVTSYQATRAKQPLNTLLFTESRSREGFVKDEDAEREVLALELAVGLYMLIDHLPVTNELFAAAEIVEEERTQREQLSCGAEGEAVCRLALERRFRRQEVDLLRAACVRREAQELNEFEQLELVLRAQLSRLESTTREQFIERFTRSAFHLARCIWENMEAMARCQLVAAEDSSRCLLACAVREFCARQSFRPPCANFYYSYEAAAANTAALEAAESLCRRSSRQAPHHD